MIQSKKINIIVSLALIFALIVSFAFMMLGNMQGENGYIKADTKYTTEVFGSDIISLEILADENDWQEMLDNATKEEYIMVDVVVNGTKFEKVGIRPKGNSSLKEVVNSDSDRYSFRLKFDQYIEGQTCFGLDSFVVNNMIGDNTYLKEYVSYDLMKEIGVDAPHFGFADIKVNGKSFGLYLAVETYSDSYESRTFGTTSGMMYNVKISNMNNKNGNNNGQDNGRPALNEGGENPPYENTKPPENMRNDEMSSNTKNANKESPRNIRNNEMSSNVDDGNRKPPTNMDNNQIEDGTKGKAPTPSNQSNKKRLQNQMDKPGGNLGGPMNGKGNNGGSLEYTTDKISSYSSIFDNAVGKASDNDFNKVITALKALSKGENLETYFDVDQILRYLAAHTIVVNLDSYSSSMAQNYYLYEKDGKVTILPWDYNLAWGGFKSSSASSVINFPIDSPVSGVEMSSRPLLEKLFSNTKYLEKYHSYLQELMTNYFSDGKWEKKITQLDSLISDYVKNDNTAFCSFEEYKTAIESFKTLGNLRYQSIEGQLKGTVPSTTEKQTEDPDSLISDNNLNITFLGSMKGGKKTDGEGGDPPDLNGKKDGENSNKENTIDDNEFKAMKILEDAGGNITDEVKSKLLDIGLTEEEISMISQKKNGFLQKRNTSSQEGNDSQEKPDKNMKNSQGNNKNSTLDNKNPSRPQNANNTNSIGRLLIYIGSFVFVLLLTFFIANKKRKY